MCTMKSFGVGVATAAATLLVSAGQAAAGPDEETGWFSITAGGGIEDFAGETMRDTSGTNGLWSLQAAVGVQRYLAVEAGYTGTAAQINAPIGNTEATLVGSSVDAIGRVTPIPGSDLQPYAFLGAGWRHYDVVGESFTTSDAGMSDSDDLLQLPVGAGLSYRRGGIIGDARFTYRPTLGEDTVLEPDGDYATMDSWGVTAGVGYQF